MPCLPSGRHVAIDAQPLNILDEALIKDPYCVHASDFPSPRAMFPWIRVLNLEPALAETVPAFKTAAGSAEVAKNLVPHDSGLCLSDWPDKFSDWTTEDREAFQQFLDGRVATFLANCRANVLELIERHRKDFRACVEEAWRREGIHPTQELGEDVVAPSVNLDAYDALTALGQCMQVLIPDEVAERLRTPQAKAARMHAIAVWRFGHDLVDWPPGALEPLASTLAGAASLRQKGRLNQLPAQERSRWGEQLIVECEMLYDSGELEGLLMPAAPRAWAVICEVTARGSLADLHYSTEPTSKGQ